MNDRCSRHDWSHLTTSQPQESFKKKKKKKKQGLLYQKIKSKPRDGFLSTVSFVCREETNRAAKQLHRTPS